MSAEHFPGVSPRKDRRYKTDPLRAPWSWKEDLALLETVGSFAIRTIERRTTRTRAGAYARLARQHGGGGFSRGSFTLRGAEAETGYHRSQLTRARRALGQAWLRTSSRGRWLISVEQLEEITNWLRTDYWSIPLQLEACGRCRLRERPHHCNGLCRCCYRTVRRVALSLRLRCSVASLLEEVTRAFDAAAPSDVLLLREFDARLRRRLVLTEVELRHLARIRCLAALASGMGTGSGTVRP